MKFTSKLCYFVKKLGEVGVNMCVVSNSTHFLTSYHMVVDHLVSLVRGKQKKREICVFLMLCMNVNRQVGC